MELSIPAMYKVNQPYTEIIDQYTNPCPLIAGHGRLCSSYIHVKA